MNTGEDDWLTRIFPLSIANCHKSSSRSSKPIHKKLELPYGTTHAMRHGAVSRFQEAGVHGDLITKWVGHASLKMTSKYTRFSAKHRKEVVAKLGAIAS
jgi:integrase